VPVRLLIAEDEQRVRSILRRGLEEEGYAVTEAADGSSALALALKGGVDLVLLDWMLPGVSGLEVLRSLRRAQNMTPVVMLTARDEVRDRSLALNEGADDYVLKPFAFEELLARIKAVLRRSGSRQSPLLACADLLVDPVAHKVTRSGRELRLTAREFALLSFLIENKGRAVTRDQIVASVWEHDPEAFSNVVDVYVRYLRNKIDEGFSLKLIHTVRGVGYLLAGEEP
jgi:two-component system copper resistance phosphate regulon response regulator CusR